MPSKPSLPIRTIILITLAWPIAQIVVFGLRFGTVPGALVRNSVVFIPLGLVSALLLTWMQSKAANAKVARGIFVGYLVASPVAVYTSLVGGMSVGPYTGSLIYGIVPLLIGMILGKVVASK